MITEIYLIRHGETPWNIEKRMQGHGGVGLTPLGRQQAQQTADRLNGDISFAALYTSDSLRAVETAQIIGEALGLTPQTDPRLRERDQGLWQGLTHAELRHYYPDIAQAMRTNRANVAPPEGENFHAVAARMHAALNEIARRHSGERVIAVSHGLAIGITRALAEGMSIAQGFDIRPHNAEIVPLKWAVEDQEN